jgi:hypothetical protein
MSAEGPREPTDAWQGDLFESLKAPPVIQIREEGMVPLLSFLGGYL